jgi:Carboxypeptidase regulatory-like domain
MISGRALALLFAALFCAGTASGQIIEVRTEGGKTFTCARTGLSSSDCGARSNWYSYVFVGSISAITPIENDEKEIQIVPEEVFFGKPATPLTVLTSAALCLPNLAVGDSWLFFLRQEKDKPIVLDYYGNDSLPVVNASKQIETLRRLQNIGEFALLRGEVLQGTWGDWHAVSGAHVIAHRGSDGILFSCNSDAEGRYEFQPLSPGKYKITVDPVGSFRPDDTEVNLRSGVCWDLMLSKSPKSPSAKLGGYVRRPNGAALADVAVLMITTDNSWTTLQTNENGHFSFDRLEPGEYVVGINLPGAPAWEFAGSTGPGVPPPPASLYYGGAADRSSAVVVKLGEGEERDNLDFIVP